MFLEERTKVSVSLFPASRGAVVNGTGVEVGINTNAMILIQNGAIGGAAASFTFQVQDSADNITYAAASADSLDKAQPTAFTASDGQYKVTYKGFKRFVRVAITAVAGTAPTLLNASLVLTDNQRENPS